MTEILLKNNQILKVKSVNEIPVPNLEFHVMQFLDYDNSDLNWCENKFGLNF